jgi:uncharacterized membrane protein
LAVCSLRALALIVAMGLLFQPSLHFKRLKNARTKLAILVDVSDSMLRGGTKNRLDKVREIMGPAKKDLDDLSMKRDLIWYHFADGLVLLDGLDRLYNPDLPGVRTDIAGAISKLTAGKNTTSLSGVVIISDGADTEISGEGTDLDVRFAKDPGIPINTVLVGNHGERKDLAIERAEMDPFAFSRSKTSIAVTLRSVGFPDREVEVFLWQDGSVVQRRTARLVGGKSKISFTVFPSTLGQQVLTVSIPTFPEDEVPENNQAHIAFEVIRDKFRILHLVGKPSWDQRFLRETLTSWPRVDLVSFYILRTAYQSATFGEAGMALIPFPTEDIFEGHLEKFDIVIFQNLFPASVGVDRYLDKIAEFVRQGGAFVLIGGNDRIGDGSMGASALKEILPFKLLGPGVSGDRLSNPTPFRVKLTEAGARHPLMRSDAFSDGTGDQWNSLARLDGVNRVASLTEGASCLAVHPFERADDGPAPVIAVKEVDKGRVLAVATDSLWRWRFTGPMGGGLSGAYTAFWRQAISWLTRSPDLERLRVAIDPSPVLVSDPTKIVIELLDESYRPVAGAVVSCAINWINQDGTAGSDAFEVTLDDKGRYRREWASSVEGPHRVTVTTADGLSSSKRFLVESREKEVNHLDPEESLLKAIAAATGGDFEAGVLSPQKWMFGDAADHQVLSHADIPLWDHPLSVFLFIALLACEWFFRRRMGLR